MTAGPLRSSGALASPGKHFVSGPVIGIVTNNSGDPDGLSRVKVKFPWLNDSDESFWARIAMPMAGNDRGTFFLPEVEDEVLVIFAHGDVRAPYVIGSLWNGKDTPPVDNSDGKNNLRVIKSRSGHLIKLNDEQGKETIEIIDGSGNNRIVIDTANNSIAITADQDIELKAPKGAIRLNAKTIELKASGTASMIADADMTVHAEGVLTVEGQTVNIN